MIHSIYLRLFLCADLLDMRVRRHIACPNRSLRLGFSIRLKMKKSSQVASAIVHRESASFAGV